MNCTFTLPYGCSQHLTQSRFTMKSRPGDVKVVQDVDCLPDAPEVVGLWADLSQWNTCTLDEIPY